MRYDQDAGEVNLTVRNITKYDVSLTVYKIEFKPLNDD